MKMILLTRHKMIKVNLKMYLNNKIAKSMFQVSVSLELRFFFHYIVKQVENCISNVKNEVGSFYKYSNFNFKKIMDFQYPALSIKNAI